LNAKVTARWTSTVDPKEWDRFIEVNRGTVYQYWTWRSVLKDCGNNPEYLVYRESGGPILAACPLFRVSVGRYRQKLTGPPFLDRVARGGEQLEREKLRWIEPLPCLFGGDVDVPEAAQALQLYLKPSITRLVSSMELLTWQTRVIECFTRLRFPHRKIGSYFLTDLEKTPPDKIWAEEFGKHDRQDVKYFDGLGASFRLSTTEEEFARFHELHDSSMLREGYSSMTEEFLAVVRRHLGDKLQLAMSVKSEELVAGQLLILDRINQTVYIDRVAYSRSRNIHSSVVSLWFKICIWAKENGFRYINFGGARTDEAYKLKRKFGGEYLETYVFHVPSKSKLHSTAAGILKTTKRLRNVVSRGQ
jgi:hypothetical protein